MPFYDKRLQPYYTFLDTLFSIARLVSQTKFKKTSPMTRHHDKCLILGNGPSLISTLENNLDLLGDYDLIAVNHFATFPEYVKYRPDKYVLCDPAFWFDESSKETLEKIAHMYSTMAEVTQWPLELYLPYQAKKCNKITDFLSCNPNISFFYYNKTKYEGWGQNRIYQKQWGMPRTQNVLIAALMLAIHSGYSPIYLLGADNDWIHNLWVDELNHLRLNDIHFYDSESAMKNARYLPVTMTDQLCSLYYAFNSYQYVKSFAAQNNSKIFNTNPHSFIDAFPKTNLA